MEEKDIGEARVGTSFIEQRAAVDEQQCGQSCPDMQGSRTTIGPAFPEEPQHHALGTQSLQRHNKHIRYWKE